MDNDFQVASTARRPGEETSDQLFVGEVTPHNAERPWLAIRGTATVVAVVDTVTVVSIGRP